MALKLSIALCALLLYLSAAGLARVPEDRLISRHSRRYQPNVPRASPMGTDEIASPLTRRLPRPSQVFRANHEKNFAWFDPVKHQELFGIAPAIPRREGHLFSKRTGGPPATAPAIPNDNCLGCSSAANGVGLPAFTLEFFIEHALWKKGTKPDQCLFYSPAYGAEPGGDIATWILAGLNPVLLNPDGTGPRLSSVATNYACQEGMQSIWMTWPGKSSDYADSFSTPQQYNFWEVSEKGSWLYPISLLATGNTKQQWPYFAKMSEAFATICTGDIYITSIQPTKLKERYSKPGPSGDDSILWTRELTTLLDRKNSKDAVGDLYALDATHAATMYQLNWDDDFTVMRQVARRELELNHSWVLNFSNASRGLTSELSPRDACNANLAYEQGDWCG